MPTTSRTMFSRTSGPDLPSIVRSDRLFVVAVAAMLGLTVGGDSVCVAQTLFRGRQPRAFGGRSNSTARARTSSGSALPRGIDDTSLGAATGAAFPAEPGLRPVADPVGTTPLGGAGLGGNRVGSGLTAEPRPADLLPSAQGLGLRTQDRDRQAAPAGGTTGQTTVLRQHYRVAFDYPRQDERQRFEHLAEMLSRLRSRRPGVAVEIWIEDESVVVQGTVTSSGERALVETLVRQEPGVYRVENRIRVTERVD